MITGFFLIGDQQTAWKDVRVVLMPFQNPGLFEPGDGDAHFGVGIAGVGVYALLVWRLAQDFSGGGHDFILGPVPGLDGA